MLHKEFENLIGRTASPEEYDKANAMYMACSESLDKETFCKDYVKHSGSKILADIMEAFKAKEKVLASSQEEVVKYRHDLEVLKKSVGIFLVSQTENSIDPEPLRIKAEGLLGGCKAYLKHKCSLGMDLSQEEMGEIAKFLE